MGKIEVAPGTVGQCADHHARQTAAAACKLGMRSELVFEKRVTDATEPSTGGP